MALSETQPFSAALLRRARRIAPYRAFARGFQAMLLFFLATLAPGLGATAAPLRVIAFGDSLTAGYGLSLDAAFPVLLERRLAKDGFDVKVINAGVSGDTTSGGLARLDFALADGADLVILELGANDMLRGVDPKLARDNLDKMIGKIKAQGAAVLLAGMRAQNNFGPDYKRDFDAIYPDLARQHAVPLYPFFLGGVLEDNSLLLDGLHPNREGVEKIVEGIAPLVETALTPLRAARSGADSAH